MRVGRQLTVGGEEDALERLRMQESVIEERGGGDDGANVVETSTELKQIAEGDAVVLEGDNDASRVGSGPSRGLELGADGGARGTSGRTRGGGERALTTTRGRLERGGQASLAAAHGPVEAVPRGMTLWENGRARRAVCLRAAGRGSQISARDRHPPSPRVRHVLPRRRPPQQGHRRQRPSVPSDGG